MKKEIEICGCIEVLPETTRDEVFNKFITFIEANGWYFGGGMREIIDGYYVSADGSREKHVLDED